MKTNYQKHFKLIIISTLAFAASLSGISQEEEKRPIWDLELSGSVDLYYKYDLAQSKNGNISGSEKYTYFAPDHNSISIGMANVILEKSAGKASFVADLGFGPRATPSSAPGLIQNLLVSYAFTDKFSVTAGYMGTFLGYEVISPVSNFNYSTSYLFSWGPFQNPGIKAEYTFSDKVSLMLGVFNDWNQYTDATGSKDIGGQLSLSPVEGWDIHLNFITGKSSGTEYDLTTGYQITEAFYLGLNAATFSVGDDQLFSGSDEGFSGIALYAQYAISDEVVLGIRGENFSDKTGKLIFGMDEKTHVTGITWSGNIALGELTIIPEFRVDVGSNSIFVDRKNSATKNASQVLIAAVYSF